jgi:hypothetical protein
MSADAVICVLPSSSLMDGTGLLITLDMDFVQRRDAAMALLSTMTPFERDQMILEFSREAA